MKTIQSLFVVIFSICILSASSLAVEPDSVSNKTEKEEFRNMIIGTVITVSYFGGYAFLLGTSLGGEEISINDDPKKATAKWAGASLLGMALGVMGANTALNSYQEFQKSDSPSNDVDGWKLYHTVFTGISASNIINFKSESSLKGAGGLPQWTANTPEVKMALTFPAVGYRLGAHGRRFGGELETSIVAHHTSEQTIAYDASGEIYSHHQGVVVPIQIDQVAIPDRFLMLHSLSIGANFYTWGPDMRIKPYLGLGGRFLLNSVQSQYPGPAELIQQKGSLAHDSKTIGWAVNIIFGLSMPISDSKFLFTEFRPSRYYFDYKSGLDQLEGKDSFTLQSFEFQFGIGFRY